MSRIRVLVGTRKGGFILTSDGKRRDWQIDGPHFGGWEVYHLNGSPADPDRIYAAQYTEWHGQVMQRSSDGGKTWEPVGNEFAFTGDAGVHKDYDGTKIPFKFKRVWHVEPSADDPDLAFAGVQDSALFRTTDGGKSWEEMDGLRTHPTHEDWAPGGGGMCLHTILIDPANTQRMYVAISAAGVLRTDDGGASWSIHNKGLSAPYLAEDEPEAGYCVHNLAMHPSRPDTVFMQKHWGVYRSDDAGGQWINVGATLPSDFGFPIKVNANEPETIYVVPIKSDTEHYPPDGRLRVYRSRTGGNEWEELSKGLPEKDTYVDVLRDAMAVDAMDPCGIYFGTTGGHVFVSADGGDTWDAIVSSLPSVASVEVQTIP
ncbi:MAG: exo-alpha-sialidase [Actinobacteria bacterium]|nr:exo-alpha-sialidase [Actinomycetota bacterium]